MGFFIFAIILGIISELLWFKFFRDGKKQFAKYDKEHSNIAVLDAEEVVSNLNKKSSLGISDIKSEPGQVTFTCKKNNYAINIQNGTACVEYDMSGCEARLSLIGKLTKRFNFWKSAHKALLINMIMDTFQDDSVSEKKEYKTAKIISKTYVVTFVAFLIFLIIGFSTFAGSKYDEAILEAQTMEFCENVTYEDLIDVYIKDAEWTAFNAENDIAIVEVNGTSIEGEKVCIQFWGNMGMGFSYSNLTLRYFDVDGVSLDPDSAMEFIYTYYYLND